MTPAQIIVEARRVLQDAIAPFRYSEEIMLAFVNQTIKRIAIARPDFFAEIAEVPTQAGNVLQTLPSDAVRVMEVFSVRGGNAVIEVDRTAMDQNYPQWVADSAAPCVNWMRHPRSPTKFFIYPKAPEGQVLIAEYATSPRDYTAGEEIESIPTAYYPVLVDGVVFLAESIDDEHVNNGRAQMYQQMFTQALGITLNSRIVTDTENAGVGGGVTD